MSDNQPADFIESCAFMLIKDRAVFMEGTIPKMPTEGSTLNTISYYKKLADQCAGDLYFFPLATSEPMAIADPDLILGYSFDQIKSKQQGDRLLSDNYQHRTLPNDEAILAYSAPGQSFFEKGIKVYSLLRKEKTVWCVQHVDNQNTDRVSGDSIHTFKLNAIKEAQFVVRNELAKRERLEAIAIEEKQEAARKIRRTTTTHIHGFGEGKPTYQIARINDVLDFSVLYDNDVLTRQELIERLLREGYSVKENLITDRTQIRKLTEELDAIEDRGYPWGNDQHPITQRVAEIKKLLADGPKINVRRLEGQASGFLDQEALTKTGLDYAQYLISNNVFPSPDKPVNLKQTDLGVSKSISEPTEPPPEKISAKEKHSRFLKALDSAIDDQRQLKIKQMIDREGSTQQTINSIKKRCADSVTDFVNAALTEVKPTIKIDHFHHFDINARVNQLVDNVLKNRQLENEIVLGTPDYTQSKWADQVIAVKAELPERLIRYEGKLADLSLDEITAAITNMTNSQIDRVGSLSDADKLNQLARHKKLTPLSLHKNLIEKHFITELKLSLAIEQRDAIKQKIVPVVAPTPTPSNAEPDAPDDLFEQVDLFGEPINAPDKTVDQAAIKSLKKTLQDPPSIETLTELFEPYVLLALNQGHRSFAAFSRQLEKQFRRSVKPYICAFYEFGRLKLGDQAAGLTNQTTVEKLRVSLGAIALPNTQSHMPVVDRPVAPESTAPPPDHVDKIIDSPPNSETPVGEKNTALDAQAALLELAQSLPNSSYVKSSFRLEQALSLDLLAEKGFDPSLKGDIQKLIGQPAIRNALIRYWNNPETLTAVELILNPNPSTPDNSQLLTGEDNDLRTLRANSAGSLDRVLPQAGGGSETERPTGVSTDRSAESNDDRDRRVPGGGVSNPRSLGDGLPSTHPTPAGDNGGRRTDAEIDRVGDGGGRSTNTQTARRRLNDYTITDQDDFESGGVKTKFKQNLAAIQLLKSLERDHRPATLAEQQVLVRYAGWGGVKNAFRHPVDGSKAKNWEKEVNQLEAVLSEDELTSARRSILDSFYTPPLLVDSIYQALKQFGFQGGKILDPATGTGHFLGSLPPAIDEKSTVTAVEIDPLSGQIAKALYPKKNIVIGKGFEQTAFATGSFDLAIGNVPFGEHKIIDPLNKPLSGFKIHDYFFLRSIDTLRDGGILAMIISNGFMDKADKRVRGLIAQQADLIGAIRLPSNTFTKIAHTEVTTDIVFLQKRAIDAPSNGLDWTTTSRLSDPEGGDDLNINQYFIDHPSMMLGTMGRTGTMYQGGRAALADDGRDLSVALGEAIKKMPSDLYTPGSTVELKVSSHSTPSLAADRYNIGGFFIEDEQLKRRTHDEDEQVMAQTITPETAYTERSNFGEKTVARLTQMIKIRDDLRQLIKLESADSGLVECQAVRASLNRQYDHYVTQFGPLNSGALHILRSDPDWPLVSSLEHNIKRVISTGKAQALGIKPRKASADKSAIFFERTISPYIQPSMADSPKDALSICLADRGLVDLDWMAKIARISVDDCVQALHVNAEKPLIFIEPLTGNWVTSSEYLSGNVKEKLKQVTAASESTHQYDKNILALTGIQPPDISAVDIKVKLGANWLPSTDYQDFAHHLLGDSCEPRFTYIRATGQWSVDIRGGSSALSTQRWGTNSLAAGAIIERIMGEKAIRITTKTDDGKTITLGEPTQLAMAKAGEIREEFDDWIFKDPARRQRLEQDYNARFNTDVLREYDGSHLVLPGKVPDHVIRMRQHQNNAVWRMVQDRTALLDHVVGAGKTYTIIAAMMEMKRMGLVQKPMVVVPNHLIEQWQRDWYTLYPGANILAITKNDFSKANRQRLLGRIATGNWDSVIIAHSSFGFIPLDPVEEQRFHINLVNDLLMAIDLLKGEGNRSSLRQLENRRSRLELKIQQLSDKPKDKVLNFTELGIDQLAVDESHEFKNLFLVSGMQRVAGLGDPNGSQKAFDMFVKTQSILNKNSGKGVIFASGTPISNSIAEMFTVQRYLGLADLEARGLETFDAWAKQYGEIVSDWELDSTATKYKLNSRFCRFVNMPELMSMYLRFGDTVTNEQIKIAYKDDAIRHNQMNPDNPRDTRFPIPEVKGGARTNIVVPRSFEQAEYMDAIIERAQAVEQRKVESTEDNMLKITGDARKAALDMRLIDPQLPYDPDSKLPIVVEKLMTEYDQWRVKKGTQLVFCDLSVPLKHGVKEAQAVAQLIENAAAGDEKATIQLNKMSHDELALASQAESKFSVYDELKRLLLDKGVPEQEIAFIHDYNTDKQKAALFEEVNAGTIRILIGSTPKMGAGTNVQQRLVALHHVDCPWRPSDLEQRQGRGIRQGNLLWLDDPDNFELAIYAYATEQTYDSRMWQVQEYKAKFLGQLKNGSVGREMEDISGDAASAAEMKAAASGNPLILQEVKLRTDISKFESLKKSHRRSLHDAEYKLEKYQSIIDSSPQKLKSIEMDAKTRDNSTQFSEKGEPLFTIEINGKLVTERSVAAKQLLRLFAVCRKNSVASEGEIAYRGFDWVVDGNSAFGQLQFSAIGATSYDGQFQFDDELTTAGILRRMDNLLNRIEEYASVIKDRLNSAVAELADLKLLVETPFKQEAELAGLKIEHAEVLDALHTPDDVGDPTVEEAVIDKPVTKQVAAMASLPAKALSDPSGHHYTLILNEKEVPVDSIESATRLWLEYRDELLAVDPANEKVLQEGARINNKIGLPFATLTYSGMAYGNDNRPLQATPSLPRLYAGVKP